MKVRERPLVRTEYHRFVAESRHRAVDGGGHAHVLFEPQGEKLGVAPGFLLAVRIASGLEKSDPQDARSSDFQWFDDEHLDVVRLRGDDQIRKELVDDVGVTTE